MHQHAIEISLEAMDLFSSHDGIADYIAKIFNDTYSGYWECKVGTTFGSFDTCDLEYCFRYFIDELAFLLYKSN
ncbi:cytoplasmic dynein light chain, putative [Schistosoma mansoni]|nr:cytoplasmic dynein light chain, putative [Schistosoma mansoni]|eukprot:XP_018646682.1 cytoplasmic dynein light chain, putative [Schistosoma mansoni]